jgi:hypothetical protein
VREQGRRYVEVSKAVRIAGLRLESNPPQLRDKISNRGSDNKDKGDLIEIVKQ